MDLPTKSIFNTTTSPQMIDSVLDHQQSSQYSAKKIWRQNAQRYGKMCHHIKALVLALVPRFSFASSPPVFQHVSSLLKCMNTVVAQAVLNTH